MRYDNIERIKMKGPNNHRPNIGSVITIQGKEYRVLRYNFETNEMIVERLK
jgi:hypothetical protein